MILTVAHTKGGVGKTTLALNLAISRARAGRRVWLVDADRQLTAQTAVAARAEAGQEPALACAAYPDGPVLRNQVRLQRHAFDDIIIDAGGRDSSALRAALVLTDQVLVPVRPRTFDVWALDAVVELIEEARSVRDGLVARAVINCADPGDRSRDNAEAAEVVRQYDERLELLSPLLRTRKAIATAAGAGLSVEEFRPRDEKGIAEMESLIYSVFGMEKP